MKSTIKNIAMAAMAAFAGCASVIDSSDNGDDFRRTGYERTEVDCCHIKLKSVMGIDDEVLKSTNRFPLAATDSSYEFKLKKPFWGCTEAEVSLNKISLFDSSGKSSRKDPHQLRELKLKKILSSDATAEELAKEYRIICDTLADMLGMESPKAELVDDGHVEREHGCSSVRFQLGNGQSIIVTAYDPIYVMREGKPVLMTRAGIEIDITFNDELGFCLFRVKENENTAVERELDFGFDCAEALSMAMRSGIENKNKRQCRVSKRKKAKPDRSPTIDCRHIKLKSIAGIDDEVLKNTDRFPLAVPDWRYEFKLEKPFLGCTAVQVGLNDMRMQLDKKGNVKDSRKHPHQLRDVKFTKKLISTASAEDLLEETQKTCDEIADLLKVEAREIKLFDAEKYDEATHRQWYPEIRAAMGAREAFNLGDEQSISVYAIEPTYFIRNGRPIVRTKGRIEISVYFNDKLGYCRCRKPESAKVAIDREIDFGFDCSEALSKAMKSSIKKTVRRKDVKGKFVGEKADKKGVGK